MKETPTYEELWAENLSVKAEAERLRSNERLLKLRIAYLERMLYGAKSDKLLSKVPDNQPGLFDEMFKEAVEEKTAQIEQMAREIDAEAKKRRVRARKPSTRPEKYLYRDLEERTTVLMPEGVDAASCDVIGKDVTRLLRRDPAKMWVEVIERPILRAKADKNLPSPRIYQAKAPLSATGGTHAGPDLLAQIIVDKYRYHMPEYRQIRQYADLGVRIPASTLNDWVHAVAQRLDPLYEAQRREVLCSDYLQVDEVPWRIADRPGKSRHGYAWQFLDSRPHSRGTYFLYMNGSRAGEIPRAELRNFRGAIQTDGYRVYNYFEQQNNVTLLGCMAHVRRKFTDAQKSHPHLASQGVKWISLFYNIEEDLKACGADISEIAAVRQSKAIPIMDAMEKWMESVHVQCTPSDPMGRALDYAYKMWPRLRRYALDGRYHIDNNPVERGQRPSVMGRKNYLFSKSDSGAVDNAIFYTLLESCDIVGVNPQQWLVHVLENLHNDMPPEQIKLFLPYAYQKSRE